MSCRRWMAGVLLILLLSGCAEPGMNASTAGSNELPTPNPARTEALPAESTRNVTDPAVSAELQQPGNDPTAPAQPETTVPAPTIPEPAVTEPAVTEPAEERPKVLSLGLYEGQGHYGAL